MSVKNSIFSLLMFIFISINFHGFCQRIDSTGLEIVEFRTKFSNLKKDSVWNLHETIKMIVSPTFLSITVKEKNTKEKLNLICVIYETAKNQDTLKLGSNPTIVINDLSGGDYELTFINLANRHEAKVKFSIAPPFWERWWFSPFVFLVISVVLGLIFYMFYLVRLRSALQLQTVRYELEIKALRAQMNPHFIFNCLNTIDGYILDKMFLEASDCLQKFSQLIRNILENSENQTISIAQELETLRLYIEIEQERFAHSFSSEFNVEAELLAKNYQIPPLLLQPFVENAILHGFRNLENRKGELLVQLKIQENADKNNLVKMLYCQIKDNGVGMAAAKQMNKRKTPHKSMGTQVTLDRIATYQALYGEKFETKVSNITGDSVGTMIEIILPLILE